MPCGPTSRAMLCATARSPNLAAAKAANAGPPRTDAVAPVKMIVPFPCGSMCRTASLPNTNAPKQASRRTFSNARVVNRSVDVAEFGSHVVEEGIHLLFLAQIDRSSLSNSA
jgi:hypothetical protein